MKSLQGDIIPLSHAFLQICIDDGEVAVAHVMEYIPAWTADTLNYKSSLKIDETSAQSLFDKLEQIHTCGVTHQGINLYNILIQPVEPLRFIFIDFGKAEEADESLKSKDKSNLAHLLARLKLRYTTLSTIFDEEDLAGIRKVPPPKSTVDVAELWRTTKPHFNWSAEPVWD
ncbi:hypothetical protein DL96DRAFT_1614684 [Flagelloscypha sp. PMI_526]|nr:hypothetical protein DL96DRAFT_1614684 [Flagelloscypha sp. PMI_526]